MSALGDISQAGQGGARAVEEARGLCDGEVARLDQSWDMVSPRWGGVSIAVMSVS